MGSVGNQYIFNSIIEANQTYKFTNNDTVIIMWATTLREDGYSNHQWHGKGNVYNTEVDHGGHSKSNFDRRGFLIRDAAAISATKSLLETIGVNYCFLSSAQISDFKENEDVYNLYRPALDLIGPSIHSTIFNNDWYSRPIGPNPKSIPDKKAMALIVKDCVQSIKNNNANFSIELLESSKIKWKIENVYNTIKFNSTSPRDFHPTPLEHLEYVEKVFPNWITTPDTQQWVNKYNDKIMGKEIIEVGLEWTYSQARPNRL
jgi:hypothetical protein